MRGPHLARSGRACQMLIAGAVAVLAFACRDRAERPKETVEEVRGITSDVAIPVGSVTSAAAPGQGTPAQASAPADAPAESAVPRASSAALAASCPAGMQLVPGGLFWVGSPGTRGPPDEHPRFSTKIPSLCVDETEVTVESYRACVEAGKCQVEVGKQKTCNYGRQGREQHPMNCVTQEQAKAYCAFRGARLPDETEWEYFARGGSEQRAYSWGDQPPNDSLTCWKRPHSCEVRSFPAGAWGLFDVIGNVWEWTDSDYGPYPWATRGAPHEVYKGGSWSRRFDKWMSPTLRNRWGRDKWGSHLGLRCVTLAPGAECPYGNDDDRCLRGVEAVECAAGTAWNGARCVVLEKGERVAAGERCRAGDVFRPGFGCESTSQEESGVVVSRAGEARASDDADPTAGVVVQRSPSFDADCLQFQPTRPVAYRVSGGSHSGRNAMGKQRGCKNRDVGVGWNSVCCPK